MHPYFSLRDRTALVTGGTRGIGKMIAKAYVEAGATVYVCARDAEACQHAYGPSKAALHQLSRILARELMSQHINVNVIAPGRFPSKMTQHIGKDEQALAQDTALIPMKRWGREEEMAALAISLASTAVAYMTGNIIPLDGGFSL
ncbi:SDR family oxidoreductase [Pseudomonas sp. PCH199]|uniref:SDR family oxidoreductase n=1 Tax=unclassified Pseudomonas TaxID=196821 RepID=UPI000BC9E0E0|nr:MULTISPECIES: SDR family oxidoreductase [unclassified Pseudomonas]MCW8277561.1 SDR family oxidoreductase [Pseudomonas sp. PCH199]PAM82211.1 hypothetical protein CES87_20060 [Pseudomonas sp. ERMR1:02]